MDDRDKKFKVSGVLSRAIRKIEFPIIQKTRFLNQHSLSPKDSLTATTNLLPPLIRSKQYQVTIDCSVIASNGFN